MKNVSIHKPMYWLILAVLAVLTVAAFWYFQPIPDHDFQPISDNAAEGSPEVSTPDNSNILIPGDPDEPDLEIKSDHQLARIQDKDASGLATLETVHTPEGVVTIQRTFSEAGVLLNEEASLGGRPVAVPER